MYHVLASLDLEDQDEVIVPAFTWWTDAAIVVEAGLKPVFVDVDFSTRNIDSSLIEAAITKKTRVILVTHLNGLPADMVEIERIAAKYRLRVIEDCARAFGAKYQNKRVGSFDIGVFSFGYGKSMYGIDGGAVVTSDQELVIRLRHQLDSIRRPSWMNIVQRFSKTVALKLLNSPLLYGLTMFRLIERFYLDGEKKSSIGFVPDIPDKIKIPKFPMPGMINVQARLCLWQLARIDQSNSRRRENARSLTKELKKRKIESTLISLPVESDSSQDVCVHYAIWSPESEQLQKHLIRSRIDAQHETAMDLTKFEMFSQWAAGSFPAADKLHGNLIFLPTHPNLKGRDLGFIADCVSSFGENSCIEEVDKV